MVPLVVVSTTEVRGVIFIQFDPFRRYKVYLASSAARPSSRSASRLTSCSFFSLPPTTSLFWLPPYAQHDDARPPLPQTVSPSRSPIRVSSSLRRRRRPTSRPAPAANAAPEQSNALCMQHQDRVEERLQFRLETQVGSPRSGQTDHRLHPRADRPQPGVLRPGI